MAAELVAFRQTRVIELAIVGEAELFHDPAGAEIRRHCKRHNLSQSQWTKCQMERLGGAFGRQALVPEFGGQAPPDLNAGCEIGLKLRDKETDETGELAGGAQLRGERTEPMSFEVRLGALDQGVALFPTQARGKELHHTR